MNHSHDFYSTLTYAVDLTEQIKKAYEQYDQNEGRTSVMPTRSLSDLIAELKPFDNNPTTFTLAFGIPPVDPVEAKRRYTPKRILRSGIATIVFWADGSKTVVKRAPDEPDNEYQAFCAALAKKIFQSNSKLKKIIKTKTEAQK